MLHPGLSAQHVRHPRRRESPGRLRWNHCSFARENLPEMPGPYTTWLMRGSINYISLQLLLLSLLPALWPRTSSSQRLVLGSSQCVQMTQSERVCLWVDCLPRGTVSFMRQDAESAVTGREDALKTNAVFRVPGPAGAPSGGGPSKCLWLKKESDSSEP